MDHTKREVPPLRQGLNTGHPSRHEGSSYLTPEQRKKIAEKSCNPDRDAFIKGRFIRLGIGDPSVWPRPYTTKQMHLLLREERLWNEGLKTGFMPLGSQNADYLWLIGAIEEKTLYDTERTPMTNHDRHLYYILWASTAQDLGINTPDRTSQAWKDYAREFHDHIFENPAYNRDFEHLLIGSICQEASVKYAYVGNDLQERCKRLMTDVLKGWIDYLLRD
jgi:hypothetical protein